MLQFVDFSQAGSIIDEQKINLFIIYISLDTPKEGKYFKALSSKYSDFESKFDQVKASRTNWRTGQFITAKLDSGHTIYCIISKSVDNYPPYLLDMVHSIQSIYDQLRSEHQDLTNCRVLSFIPTADELKISDSIFIPSIVDALHEMDIQTWAVSSGDHEKYVDRVTEGAVYYKMDSWQHDWMLTADDILFVEILATVQFMSPNFKINKTSLARAYHICHTSGKMYNKLEFYATDFGPTFKLFLPKVYGLVNHSILVNTHHFSKTEPPRFSCILGPGYNHVRHLNYSKLTENKVMIRQLARDIIKANIEAYKERAENSSNDRPNTFNKPKSSAPSSFSL